MSTHISEKRTASARPTVFVDSNVIAAYLSGGEAAAQLFEDGYRDRVRFAVDPVVLQNMLSLPQVQESPALVESVHRRLDFQVLPLDVEKSRKLLERAKALRNRIAHSSDVLVAASASDCDYLITYEPGLKELIEGDRPHVVTPEEFTSLIPSH